MPQLRPSLGQKGQMFAGYFVGLLVLMAMAVSVMKYVMSQQRASAGRIYEEQALNVARAGFEDALSFFRRQTMGVALPVASVDQTWQAPPWNDYPDWAFQPTSADTDHFTAASVSIQAGAVWTSKAIIRDFELYQTGSGNTNTAEMKQSPAWARYVIRRQNVRNWSPGNNTYSAFTDPEAAHDLTHLRGNSEIGAGNVWGITSRGYVYASNTALTLAAAHESNSLVSPPKRFYNGKRLLLASAKVYGELYRMNFKYPAAAVFVGNASGVSIMCKGAVNGGSAYGVAKLSGSVFSQTTTAGVTGGIKLGSPAEQSVVGQYVAPTVSSVFPGLNKAILKGLADKVGGIECFPLANDPNLTTLISRTSFIYVTTTGLAGSKIIFPAGTSTRVMSGVGMVFIDGNLEVQAKNLSSWAGMVFVDGNVTIRGPGEVSGMLIATGTVVLGNQADLNNALVEYNADSMELVRAYLQNFQVLKSSIVATVP